MNVVALEILLVFFNFRKYTPYFIPAVLVHRLVFWDPRPVSLYLSVIGPAGVVSCITLGTSLLTTYNTGGAAASFRYVKYVEFSTNLSARL